MRVTFDKDNLIKPAVTDPIAKINGDISRLLNVAQGTYLGLRLSRALTDAFLAGGEFAAREIQRQLAEQGIELELGAHEHEPNDEELPDAGNR